MRGPIGLIGVFAAAGLAFSFYTTGVCSCLTVAQQVVASAWDSLDEAQVSQRLAKRYPPGTPMAEVPKRVGLHYDKYCAPEKPAVKVVCLMPHEQNAWRTVSAELTLAFDAEQRLQAARAQRRVKYVWE